MTMRPNPVRWLRAPKRFRVQRTPLGAGIPAVLASASSWYDARDILTSDQQTLVNRVGVGLATFGSTTGEDFSDPVRLPHDGTNYVWDPRVAGNSIQAALDTGCSTASTTVVTLLRKSLNSTSGKWFFVHTGPANTGRFNLLANNSGVVLALTRDVDAGVHAITMPLANPFSVDHLRVTIEWDALGPGLARTTLEHSNDPIGSITWTATAPVDTGGVAVRRPDGAGTFTIGHPSAAANGDALYRLSIAHDGSAPTVLFDAADATDQTGSVLVSGGTSWNIVRSASGLATAVVTRPEFGPDGSDDRLDTPDTMTFGATAGTGTVALLVRPAGLGTAQRIWSSESANNVGAWIDYTGTTITAGVGGSTTTATATRTLANGWDLATVALVKTSAGVAVYVSGAGLSTATSTTGVGTVTHGTGARVASRLNGTALGARTPVLAVATYPNALAGADLDTLHTLWSGTGTYT